MLNTKKTLLALTGFFFTTFSLFYLGSKGLEHYSKMPSESELFAALEQKSYHRHSEVLDRNGLSLGYLSVKNRSFIPLEKIPKRIVSNFLLLEDESFYEHRGFLFLNLFKQIFSSSKEQELGTITQKLSKLYFQNSSKDDFSLVQNILLSSWLESNLSKEEILEHYLNRIPMTNSSHGLGSASRELFNKGIEDLSFEEELILSIQRPYIEEEKTKLKKRLLSSLKQNRTLSPNEFEYWKRRKLQRPKQKTKNSELLELVSQELKRLNLSLTESQENLIIHTSLDLDYRNQLMKASKKPEPFLLVDQTKGSIRAISHKNHLDTTAQLGNSLVPSIIGFSLDKGFSFHSKMSFNPYTKRTRNSTDQSIYEALVDNDPKQTAELILSLGTGVVGRFIENFDLGLGHHDLSLANSQEQASFRKLAPLYGSLFNQGVPLELTIIEEIQAEMSGKRLYLKKPQKREVFITPEAAYMVEKALESDRISSFVASQIRDHHFWFFGSREKLMLLGRNEKPMKQQDFKQNQRKLLESLQLKLVDEKAPFLSSKISFGKSKIEKYKDTILPFKNRRKI